MTNVDISLTIGGDAGQGIQSTGAGFSKALARGGLHVFSVSDYRSRIRGGHNFYQIRAAHRPLYSHSDPVHVLLALTPETVKLHWDDVAEQGAVIYDKDFDVDRDDLKNRGLVPVAAPLREIAEKQGSRVMMNTAGLGTVAGLIDYPLAYLKSVIEDNFADKGKQTVSANLAVAESGHRVGKEHSPSVPFSLDPQEGPERMVLHGNQAFCLGAAAAGCRFVAAYPMTPGTSVLEWMTSHARQLGIVTKHVEDEIAAMCMVIGASHAGARAMTSTSGGGFDLMTEALSLAGMSEVPVVCYLAQRGGPSTGLPTRTEQGDLLLSLHAAHGEFPRMVLAPGTIEQCFEAGWRAFNLAEKYQAPCIVVSDQFLASSVRTMQPHRLDRSQVTIERGKTLTHDDLDHTPSGPYQRFALSEDGISPRAIPGHPSGVFKSTGNEHDESGHITEDQSNRRDQMSKRMKKLEAARQDMRAPTWYGPDDAGLTIICWGSMYGPAREAVDQYNDQEPDAINLLHFSDIWPFPTEKVQNELQAVRRSLCVEQNFTSQFARFLRMETGYQVDHQLNKYDGRPYAPEDIVKRIREEVLTLV